jgi:hypothetical protein
MMDLAFRRMMKRKRVVIIGAGELGSRHLQSLAKSEFDVHLQVVDPSPAALALAETRFHEIPKNAHILDVDFFSDLSSLNENLDFAIIATNSDIRLKVLSDLLNSKKVATLLLEKVLFTSVDELEAAQALIEKKQVRAYVNCPKRGYPSTELIRERILGCDSLEYQVTGENWGLGCNAIHFIDTMSTYCQQTNYALDTSQLDSKIIKSKRPGFIEFTGELTARFSSGKILRMVSLVGDLVSFQTRLESEREIFLLDERSGELQITNKLTAAYEKIICKAPYQSELTHKLAQVLLFGGEISVPDFHVSAALHRPLLSGLLGFYNQLEKQNHLRLCIT